MVGDNYTLLSKKKWIPKTRISNKIDEITFNLKKSDSFIHIRDYPGELVRFLYEDNKNHLDLVDFYDILHDPDKDLIGIFLLVSVEDILFCQRNKAELEEIYAKFFRVIKNYKPDLKISIIASKLELFSKLEQSIWAKDFENKFVQTYPYASIILDGLDFHFYGNIKALGSISWDDIGNRLPPDCIQSENLFKVFCDTCNMEIDYDPNDSKKIVEIRKKGWGFISVLKKIWRLACKKLC